MNGPRGMAMYYAHKLLLLDSAHKKGSAATIFVLHKLI